MSEYINYQQCPVCRSAAISPVFNCIDSTATQQVFEVWKCASCTARFTQKAPNAQAIGVYYRSNDYVSHTDTKKGFINTVYHWVRNFTLQQKRRFLQSLIHSSHGNLVDAGAGTGAFAETMLKAGWNVTGIEPDEEARSVAKQSHGIDLLPPESLTDIQKGSIDVVTMWHVLEHVHDLHGYLETFERLLKPVGKLVVAVPNYTSYDATQYGNCWAAYDVPRHLYHFSPKSMHNLMQAHGFTITNIKPMWFDSFYVSMLSERNKRGMANYLKALWYGLLTDLKTLRNVEQCSSLIYVMEKSGTDKSGRFS